MSDWDKIDKMDHIPRNDPKLEREPDFTDYKPNMRTVKAGLDLAKDYYEQKNRTAKGPFRKPKTSSTSTPIKPKATEHPKDPMAFRPKSKANPSRLTDKQIEMRRRLREERRLQKQRGRAKTHYVLSENKKESSNETTLTTVFFVLILFAFRALLPFTFKGPVLLLTLFITWIFAKSLASSMTPGE